MRDAASLARCTPRGPAMQSTRAIDELLDLHRILGEVVGRGERRLAS